ncbi:MAG: preprotein translocase subunit SecG [Planctomycetaceae bacterium]|nr:preprotein translocase subunit SecG [Planctomycetaceae bacterium]
MDTFLALVGMFISVVLIGIILLQRGRGGGLVGALSGLGGQSAFGTKAGDTFTRITIGIAAAWVILAGVHGQVLRSNVDSKTSGLPDRIEVPKEREPSASSTKSGSGDSKKRAGLGSSITDETDELGKDVDLKKKSKSTKPEAEDTLEDPKKSETDTKPADSKEDAKKDDELK